MTYADVFRTADVSTLAVVKSVLDGAGLSYVVQGESALTLLPVWGGLGAPGVAAVVQVPEEDAEAARELLRGVADP